MRKILLALLTVGIIVGLSGAAYAVYPTSITVDPDANGGADYTAGLSYLFSAGTYIFSVPANYEDAGAWSTYNLGTTDLGYEGWLWSMNIYDPVDHTYYLLGDDSSVFPNGPEAHAASAGSSIPITISSDRNLRFYIYDISPHENTGMVTANVVVVPEPLSSVLFVVGSLALGVVYYRKRTLRKI